MKRSLFLSILLLMFVIGCSRELPTQTPVPSPEPSPIPPPSPSPEPSSEYAMQLATQFSPIINLNGEAEIAEYFEPDPVQLMLEQSILRDLEDPAFSEKPDVGDLLRWSQSAYYLDVIDLDPKIHSVAAYKAAYDEVKENYQPTVYARVKEAEGTDYTVVQYWLFYYLNDWRNIHEGDWELIQLNFPGHSAKELLANAEQPVFVAYSQHQAGQRISWSDMVEAGMVTGTHPKVYVARGSHANYFAPGQFWSGLDFDDTGLSSWKVVNPEQFNIVLLPEVESEGGGLEWMGFQGYWGEYLGFSISILGLKFWQRGPFGPLWSEEGKQSRKWEHPDAWAVGLPQYPQPFWTSFFKLPGDWSKLAIFSLFSPANLHVYDSQGRHIGIDKKGKVEKQIPEAVYITPEGTHYQIIVIPNADVSQEYTLVVKGTGSGIAEIKAQVPDSANKSRRYLRYKNVPVSPKAQARVKILPDAALLRPTPQSNSVRDNGTKLELDSDGDDTYELESTPGDFERKKAARPKLKDNIQTE
ncbi:hypothetical protein ACFLVM_00595 [Chloroflexota bacterium]